MQEISVREATYLILGMFVGMLLTVMIGTC